MRPYRLFCLLLLFSLQAGKALKAACVADNTTSASAICNPKFHYQPRGSLTNSRILFERGQKARVAFLGGSITEMDGWRNLICEKLKQRFPSTDFEFVAAGIGSTGSTPGAFRLENDVLSAGKVDLLFVEAAVNDDTNGFSPLEQVRGMEGIVRHARMSNPDMDVVMLHFIYDPFIEIFAEGKTPDVILNHERVANHYLIPSVNLAQEIAERMKAGEFDWNQFGGTHPAPLGHQYYAATIARLLDEMWAVSATDPHQVVAHPLPEKPLDPFSYFGGKFVDLKEAKLGKGWRYEASWSPDVEAETRNGFVNVPMLESKTSGAKLTLEFEGTAVGIFCVAGPQAGVLEYSVDGKPFKSLDTSTAWSAHLYIPWLYLFEDQLINKKHQLIIRLTEKNESSRNGKIACQIRNFVVNSYSGFQSR